MLSKEEKYQKYRPKKFLGQNFLVDDNIARKIVNSLNIDAGDTVLEIGPGYGALTKHIVNICRNYFAVEIDADMAANLKDTYSEKINIISKDILTVDIAKEITAKNSERIKIIGNIPYNITTEILFKIFESRAYISEAVLMMQKEVAQRLTSKPGLKDYGILAVQTQHYCKPTVLFGVPPTAFFPKPTVNSSIVRLVFEERGGNVTDEALFKKIVKDSFGKRRKVMRNSLKDLFAEKNIGFTDIDFDFSRRPESLSVAEFEQLSNSVYNTIDSGDEH